MKKKVNAPKKLVGGRILGKEGDMWFAVKVSGFEKQDFRDFKSEFGLFCKEFLDPPEDQEESD